MVERHDGWNYVRPQEIEIADFFSVTRKREKGKTYRVQQPSAILRFDGKEIMLHGYNLMWDFLDSLFKERLPRRSVNQAMFHNPLFIDDLRAFIVEADVPWIALQAKEEGDMRYGLGLVWNGLCVDCVSSAEIQCPDLTLQDLYQEKDGWQCDYLTVNFIDRKGVHRRPALLFTRDTYRMVWVVELGKRLAVYGRVNTPKGWVRPNDGWDIVHKTDMLSIINTVTIHMDRVEKCENIVGKSAQQARSMTDSALNSVETDRFNSILSVVHKIK